MSLINHTKCTRIFGDWLQPLLIQSCLLTTSQKRESIPPLSPQIPGPLLLRQGQLPEQPRRGVHGREDWLIDRQQCQGPQGDQVQERGRRGRVIGAPT